MLHLKQLLLPLMLLQLSTISVADDYIKLQEQHSEWIRSAFNGGKFHQDKDIRSLGNLVKVSCENDINSYKPNLRKLITYRFEGLVLKALRNIEYQDSQLTYYIKISSDHWTLSNGIKVGDGVDVLDGIPIPVQLDGNEKRYCGYDNCLIVIEKAGKIKEILFSLYSG